MKRRLVSMLLVLSMVFPLLPVQAFAAGAGNSHEPNRLLAGGLYDPRYVRHSAGPPAGVNPDRYAGPSTFSDVAHTAYYAPYVAWAAQYGVILGTGAERSPPAPMWIASRWPYFLSAILRPFR